MRHSVDTALLQQALNQLVKQPYSEVASLLQSIQKDAVVIPGTAPEVATSEAPKEVQEGSISDTKDIA